MIIEERERSVDYGLYGRSILVLAWMKLRGEYVWVVYEESDKRIELVRCVRIEEPGRK